jgi:adenylate kinase family enzyme
MIDPAAIEPKVGKRVIIVGSSNAGKTTFGARLAERIGAPFIELDGLHWEPGWVEAEREVFRERVRRAIASESWVIDGNYRDQQQDVSWPLADTVIWLDLPLATVLRRCAVRTWRRWRRQERLYGGTNRENIWEHLALWNTEKSLFSYTLKTHRARRRIFEAAIRDPRWAHIRFIRLRSVAEVDRWLAGVPARRADAHAVGEEPALISADG